VKILRKHKRFNFRLIGQILKISLGRIGQNLIATSSWVGLIRIISVFGSDAIAGYTIAIRIIISGIEEKGVFLSIVIAESLMTIMVFFLFRRGRWKLNKV